MNNKDFKKNFIENFKEQNNPNILFEDTFDKELVQNNNIYYNRYISLKKRHKLQTIFSCVLILLLIVGMSVVLFKNKDFKNKENVMYELSSEELDIMYNSCGKIDSTPNIIINLYGNQYIYFYKIYCSDSNSIQDTFYFYKIVNYKKPFTILYKNEELYINENNTFSVLCKTNTDFPLELKIIFENNTYFYQLT